MYTLTQFSLLLVTVIDPYVFPRSRKTPFVFYQKMLQWNFGERRTAQFAI